jgi:hypothetical protein
MHAAKKYQVFLCSVRRLLVAASVVPSSPILVTRMNEALGSSETSLLQEPHGNIPEDTILQFVCSSRKLLYQNNKSLYTPLSIVNSHPG